MGSLLHCWAQVTAGRAQKTPAPQSAWRTGEVSGLLLSVHRLSIPCALAALALVASCVSGLGGGEGEEELASTWAGFTKSCASDQEG